MSILERLGYAMAVAALDANRCPHDEQPLTALPPAGQFDLDRIWYCTGCQGFWTLQLDGGVSWASRGF